MKAVLENGGFDASGYNVSNPAYYSPHEYNKRKAIMREWLHQDLVFFNQILFVIAGAFNDTELEENMSMLFSRRLKNLINGYDKVFSYGYTDTRLEVYQNGNEKPLIYVELLEPNKNEEV